MPGKLFVLTGPSGVGKTTIAERLLTEMPDLTKLVTHASRDPRPNEQDGVDYHFVDKNTFRRMVDEGAFFEWAEVYDEFKGISTAELENLLASGKHVLMVIDVQGARTIKEKRPDATTIFLTADSVENLMTRLKGRGTNNDADLEKRRAQLETEIAFAEQCDHVVVNTEGQIDQTVEQVRKIIKG
ncbi:MAG: guanylate kinase [Candidatus Uhrbacteria bacterium]